MPMCASQSRPRASVSGWWPNAPASDMTVRGLMNSWASDSIPVPRSTLIPAAAAA